MSEYRSTAWLQQRKGTVGSSDIPTILGLNKYKSALELWAEKCGKIEPKPAGPAAEYGLAVEGAIQRLFAADVVEFGVEPNNATITHPDPAYDWATATPDSFLTISGATDYDTSGSARGILEIKHTSIFSDWQDGATPYYAQCQLQWQLGVCDLRWGFIAAVVGGRAADLQTRFYRFDAELYDSMLETAAEFMRCVNSETPPSAVAGDKKLIDRLFERDEAEAITLPGDLVDKHLLAYDAAVEQLAPLKQQVRALEAEKTAAQENIKLLMGEYGRAELPDGREAILKRVAKKPYTVTPRPYWTFKIK